MLKHNECRSDSFEVKTQMIIWTLGEIEIHKEKIRRMVLENETEIDILESIAQEIEECKKLVQECEDAMDGAYDDCMPF